MGVFLQLSAARAAAANAGADTDTDEDADAGAGADAGACLVAPVLRVADGSPHQICADAGLEGGSALLMGAGDH